MIKATKGILLPVITLLLTLIALATTTFAWVSLSKVVTASNISGNIAAGDGLEIALGLEGTRLTSYRSHLTASDWQTVMNELTDYKTTAVSTKDGTTFYKLAFDNSNAPGLYKVEAYKNVDYLEFEIHFKSYSSGKVYFDDYKFLSEAVVFNPRVDYDNDGTGIKEITQINAYAHDAVRIKIGDVIYQNAENQTNHHTSNRGVNYGQFSYLTEMGNDIYWSNNELDDLIKLTNDNITDVLIADAVKVVGEDQVATLNETNNFTAKVTIKIWIEGFDAEAYDAIFGSNLAISLSFKKENIE